MIKVLKMAFSVLLLITVFSVSDSVAQDCSYWNKNVGVKNIDHSPARPDKTNPDEVLAGIECLLKLKGDKSRGAFSGASHNDVSQQLPDATVEICALYYISYLFYEKYEHANGVALHERTNLALNTNRVINKAYKSYRKWFETVKRIGLEEARKQKLDPLDGSAVRWY